MRRAITTIGFLCLALLPMMATVPPATAASSLDPMRPSQMPVAIAQPLGTMDAGPLAAMGVKTRAYALIPEPGMLVLVGSALLGLATVVRRTTNS